jgi:hypothetical protein
VLEVKGAILKQRNWSPPVREVYWNLKPGTQNPGHYPERSLHIALKLLQGKHSFKARKGEHVALNDGQRAILIGSGKVLAGRAAPKQQDAALRLTVSRLRIQCPHLRAAPPAVITHPHAHVVKWSFAMEATKQGPSMYCAINRPGFLRWFSAVPSRASSSAEGSPAYTSAWIAATGATMSALKPSPYKRTKTSTCWWNA